ncbi:MAG: hypothetical protein HY689_08335 [Chloroflexi bacterium]|nr:hypothetical protein [Chloroflexota bacterium]
MARRNRRKPHSELLPLERVQTPAAPPVPPGQAHLARQLHALADAASGYLRYHPDRTVRRAVALLAAATLAASTACGPAAETIDPQPAYVQRAAPQANAGFPPRSGDYEVRPGSLQMDTGGTYYIWWYVTGPGGAVNLARGSNVKLVEDDRTFLRMEADGQPVLHLKTEEPIGLVAPGEASLPQATPTPGASQSVAGGLGYHSVWYPFWLSGGNTVIIERDRPVDRATTRTPGYYAPPSGDIDPGGQVRGGTRTATTPSGPPPFQLKTTAVSGRAGGTGAGTAATGKSGGSTSRIGAPRSGGFSSGKGSGLFGGSLG